MTASSWRRRRRGSGPAYGLRPTAAYMGMSSAASAARSGRHCGIGTRPGSTRDSPSKKRTYLGAGARREDGRPEFGVVPRGAGRHRLRVDVPGRVRHRRDSFPTGPALISLVMIACGSSASGTYCMVHSTMTATGLPKSSVSAARRKHLAGIAQVGVDIRAGALGRARQQRPRVGEHDRVVVHVDDPAVRRDPLGDLMGVLRGGQAGADVEELADSRLEREVAHRAVEKRAVGAHAREHDRADLDDRLGGRPVRGVVVLAAKEVIVDTSRVGGADVE